MATGVQNLQTALDAVRAKLAEVLASPKPNYSIEGQSVDRAGYYSSLLESERLLVEALLRAEGPFEIVIRGRP